MQRPNTEEAAKSSIHTGNLYRKANALQSKTTATDRAPGEVVAALEPTYRIVRDNGLNADRLDWLRAIGYGLASSGGVTAVVAAPKPEPLTKRKTYKRRFIAPLSRPEGATAYDLLAMTKWQQHTAGEASAASPAAERSRGAKLACRCIGRCDAGSGL